MPNYKILLFGICRDQLQVDYIFHATNEVTTAENLLSTIKSAYHLLNGLPSLRLAVDHHFPKPSFIVEENMEIALIPPVSGG